jgi:prepilin-type N-terminal cleavage/methylation domain-containing protein
MNMRNIRTKGGFSLVELLTVIAIIAILAAIIFPVMTSVKKEAKMTQCITNLHNVAMAMQHYQMDNRKYPTTLGPLVTTGTNGSVIPMERVTLDKLPPGTSPSLYPEYINTVKGFHCPLASLSRTDAVVQIVGTGTSYYSYDNYDVFYPGTDLSATIQANAYRYMPEWAASQAGVIPFPPGAGSEPDSPDLQAYDYKRQLKFRAPSKDTVVTWCSFHASGTGQGMIPVLFLDGHCDKFPLKYIEGVGAKPGTMWRVHPHL